MKLTESNYFSPKANSEYMSFSQWKQWLKCPAMAKAEVSGEWKRPTSKALLESSYGDVALLTPDDLEAWMADNKEDLIKHKLMTQKGAPSSYLRKVDAAIDAAKASPFFMSYLEGSRQEILAFDMFGVPWKAKLDVLLAIKRVVDLKMMGKLDNGFVSDRIRLPGEDYDEWRYKGFRGEWYETYNYYGQGAVYREAVRQKYEAVLPFFLAVLTKSDSPEGRVVHLNDEERFDLELREIRDVQPLVMSWKRGNREAPRCNKGDCPYCSTHWLDEVWVGMDYRFADKDKD